MGKQSRARVLADHQAMAIGRNIRVSPRKLNLVAQQIRGKKVDRALNELSFSEKRIARDVKKVLQSAIANAENNHDLDVDDLVVREAIGRQESGDEAVPCPRPRQFRRHREILQPDHHRGRGKARSREEGSQTGGQGGTRGGRQARRQGQEGARQEAGGEESRGARRGQEAPCAKRSKGESANGSEGQSDRPAPGHQPHLGLALVRGQEGIWQAPAGRHQDPRLSQRQAEGRRRQPHRDRAAAQEVPGHHPFRPSRAW